MAITLCSFPSKISALLPLQFPAPRSPPKNLYPISSPPLVCTSTRRAFSAISATSFILLFSSPISSSSSSLDAVAASDFIEIEGSGGVKAFDVRRGGGEAPVNGDQVAIHYYGRLAAKQGWRFDSTYDHRDEMGGPVPFVFFVGSGKVISGIDAAVRSMKVGGIRRVIIPPSEGYQNTSQEPIPPNVMASICSPKQS